MATLNIRSVFIQTLNGQGYDMATLPNCLPPLALKHEAHGVNHHNFVSHVEENVNDENDNEVSPLRTIQPLNPVS